MCELLGSIVMEHWINHTYSEPLFKRFNYACDHLCFAAFDNEKDLENHKVWAHGVKIFKCKDFYVTPKQKQYNCTVNRYKEWVHRGCKSDKRHLNRSNY